VERVRDAGTAAGQGGSKKLRVMETYKTQINRYQLCLLPLNNNVDLKSKKK